MASDFEKTYGTEKGSDYAGPGLQDATYQDFIAPLMGGLGIAKAVKAASNAPAIIEGLSSALPNAAAPTTAAGILDRFASRAQLIGDWPRVMKYKALRAAMEQTQMPFEEVFETILKIHAS